MQTPGVHGAVAQFVRSSSAEFDENTVTPGVFGFIAIFLIAVVTVLLVLDMTRRVRRTRYRGEISQQLDAEDAERQAADRAPNDIGRTDIEPAETAEADIPPAGSASPNDQSDGPEAESRPTP